MNIIVADNTVVNLQDCQSSKSAYLEESDYCKQYVTWVKRCKFGNYTMVSYNFLTIYTMASYRLIRSINQPLLSDLS